MNIFPTITGQHWREALARSRAEGNTLAAQVMAIAQQSADLRLLRSVADHCGWQEDGMGGGCELWTLRKPLGRHPAGSTVTRATVLRLLSLRQQAIDEIAEANAEGRVLHYRDLAAYRNFHD